MKKILKILPHTLIVLALIFIVIEILNWYNPYMNFFRVECIHRFDDRLLPAVFAVCCDDFL